MNFLAPAMLLGAAGVAIPIALHLIGRRRAKRVRFAAVDFLLGSNKRVARRLQLRELLLLASRVLVCLAIPLALAKPVSSCAADGPAVARGPQAAVLVVDNTLAAAATVDGRPLADRIRAAALTLLDRMGPEAEIAIVPLAEGAPAPDGLGRDPLALRDTLAGMRPQPRPGDLAGALARAARLLAQSRQAVKTIYVIGVPVRGWTRGDLPDRGDLPPIALVNPLGGAPGERTIDNAAVVDVQVQTDPAAGSRGVRVTATVANFGTTPIDERGIRLSIDGRPVAAATVSLRPGEQAVKRFAAALPNGAKRADLVVELDPDALPVDDRHYVRAQLRDDVRALLVDGDARTIRHEDELFYLETALRPGDRGDSGVVVTRALPDDLADLSLDAFDVVVLANVRALSPPDVSRLVDWLRAGGGLFITVGDRVGADDYNAAMADLLPQQLRDPIDTGYGARGPERDVRALRLAKLDRDHPVLAPFDADATGLRDARFYRVMLLGPTTRVEHRRVLMRYSNGAAALVEGELGDGHVLLWTSTIDRDWTDFPIHPGFLPLVQRAVRHLARKPDDGQRRDVRVGWRYDLPILPDTTRVEIVGPTGRTIMEGERVAGRSAVTFADTDTPGLYRVSFATASGKAERAPEADFAVNLDPRASDVRRLDLRALTEAAPDVAGRQPAARPERRVELWHAIAVGLLGLLLLESVLVARR